MHMSGIALNFQDNFIQHCSQICELCVAEQQSSYLCLSASIIDRGGGRAYMSSKASGEK